METLKRRRAEKPLKHAFDVGVSFLDKRYMQTALLIARPGCL